MSLITSPFVLSMRRAGRALGVNRMVTAFLGRGNYEQRFSSLMLDAIRKDDCVWDIGANIGHYATLFADRVGTGGHVVCFEPSPSNAERLAQATREKENLTILSLALGATSGTVRFFQGQDDIGATSRVFAERDKQPGGGVDVRVARGDDIVMQGVVPRPTVLKIDTEGFELDVLSGLQKTLETGGVRAVFVEVHFGLLEDRGQPDAPGTIEKMLKNAGFRCAWPDASHIAGFRTER